MIVVKKLKNKRKWKWKIKRKRKIRKVWNSWKAKPHTQTKEVLV